MHQFLGDAADVDAGATELPGGADRGRRDVVSNCDLFAELSSGLGGRKTAGTSTDDEEIVVVLSWLRRLVYFHVKFVLELKDDK